MTEDFTPSIHIQPPPDSDEQALFDFASFGMFDNNNTNNYCSSSESERDMNFGMAQGERCYPPAPALFIQPSDSSSVAELSPLDEIPFNLQTDYRYSPSTSGRSSPIDAWSPVSSFSGDIPEEHDDFWTHQGLSSPHQGLSSHSSPSLSPITSALDNVRLDERYPAVDQSVLLSGPPIVSRLRSSSHSVQGVSPAEVWASTDGVGRGRSASFTATTTDNQFYRNDSPAQPANFQYGYSSHNETVLSESFGTGMSWGTESHANVDAAGDNLGRLTPGWTYPSNEQPSSPSVREPPATPSLLTVPTMGAGLQRRGAFSARQRSRSHSDLATILPSQQDLDLGRGRGTHRTTLSIPNSRSVSNGHHSRASSRDVSPHSPHSPVCFSAVQTPESFSPSSASSSAFEDAEMDGDGVAIGRRRTFSGVRGSSDLLLPTPALSRASSAPSSKARRSRIASSPRNNPGLSVFKAVKVEAPSAFLSPHGSDGSHQEFRVAPPEAPPSFKAEVASKKIRTASSARRINAALFACPLPGCPSTFTARHNLNNHINSHNKYRPHRCMCGMSFTTQGVLNRHKKRCSRP